jgi:protein-S-isoprenylcysteine O-methyltransferase Ste14
LLRYICHGACISEMTRETLGKIMLIVPSSVFFFILVPLASLYVGIRVDVLSGLPALEQGKGGTFVASSLLLVGAYFVLGSIQVLLVEGGGVPLGDVLPSGQSTDLVMSGVYRLTRNPMLFGYLLCLMAQGILLKSMTTAFIIPIIFIFLWSVWLKKREEPGLEARFGETYREYRRRTPFLVPRPWRKFGQEPKR